MRSFIFALVLAIAGCSAGTDTPDVRAAAVAHASAYRGPAVVTGKGDLAACPLRSDLDQYHNDMMNMKVDPDDPGYEVARAYDLRNRRCIELMKGARVHIEGGNSKTESRVRPFGRSQTYWTMADWMHDDAVGEPGENGAPPAGFDRSGTVPRLPE